MANNSPSTTALELERRWQERVRTGAFSPAVLGVGTIRVMGRSGDAAVQFPRITSLDILDTLAPDEQWAVRAAEQIVAQAQRQSRAVFEITPVREGSTPTPRPVQTFDPRAESLMVVARIAGG